MNEGKMNKVVAVLAGIATLGGLLQIRADAQIVLPTTSIQWQVSVDAVNWASAVDALPGTTVYARAVVGFAGLTTPAGLAAITFQPTISGWSGDTLQPFVANGQGGNTTVPSGAAVQTLELGRLRPFASTVLDEGHAITGFYHQNVNGTGVNYMRVAQANATDWMGEGNNATGDRGVPITQFNNVGRTPAEPPFNNQSVLVPVFRMAFRLGPSIANRPMTVDSPQPGIGYARWWATMDQPAPTIDTILLVTHASVFALAGGACCTVSTGACVVAHPSVCTSPRLFRPDSLCTPDACLPRSGACCLGSSCMVAFETACLGIFQGDGITCGAPSNPTTCCAANFNGASGLTVQDVFDFLAAYFGNNSQADFNHVDGLTVQDIFDFLAAYFQGC